MKHKYDVINLHSSYIFNNWKMFKLLPIKKISNLSAPLPLVSYIVTDRGNNYVFIYLYFKVLDLNLQRHRECKDFSILYMQDCHIISNQNVGVSSKL